MTIRHSALQSPGRASCVARAVLSAPRPGGALSARRRRAAAPQPRPGAPAPRSMPRLPPRAAAAPDADSVPVAPPDLPGMQPGGSYDAAANAAYWQTRPVPVVARCLVIAAELARWAAAAKLTGGDERRSAALLRESLVRLGPAFVKIGQALSSRPDIMPPVWLEELEQLQDRIPPFPTKDAMEVLRLELGVPPLVLFSEMSAEPVAAASLGQVYRARLKSTGDEVAIKVQRPGVVEAIALDTYILRYAAGALRAYRRLNTDLPALVDEWASSLFRELDYRREAANGRRFAELFCPLLPEIKVPAMHLDYTTARILTMEWIEGTRLRSASKQRRTAATAGGAAAGGGGTVSGTAAAAVAAAAGGAAAVAAAAAAETAAAEEDLRLVEVGVRCSLEQMLEEGFYHADPHPGNLLKTPDGKLAYLDFGMMGTIERPVRQALVRATLHLVNREYSELAQDFLDLGLLPPGSDMGEIVPALTGVFQTALAGGVSNISFSTLSGDLGRTMYRFSFRIPPYYTLLVRSLSVLEGIALASDPDYKVLGAAYPWISRRLLTRPSPELRATLRRLLYKGGSFRFDRLEQLLEQAARARETPAPSRVAAAAAAAAASVNTSGSSTGSGGSPLALLLSPDGSYVRDILEDEIAKGLDAAWRLAGDAAASAATSRLSALFSSGPAAALLGGGGSGGSGGGGDSAAGSALVQDLLRLPRLSEESDAEQIRGLTRLAATLGELSSASSPSSSSAAAGAAAGGAASSSSSSGPSGRSGGSSGGRSTAAALSALGTGSSDSGGGSGGSDGSGIGGGTAALVGAAQETVSALQWLATELQRLGPEERREALVLPIAILQKAGARAAARAVRWALAPGPFSAVAAAALAWPLGGASSGSGSAGAGTAAAPWWLPGAANANKGGAAESSSSGGSSSAASQGTDRAAAGPSAASAATSSSAAGSSSGSSSSSGKAGSGSSAVAATKSSSNGVRMASLDDRARPWHAPGTARFGDSSKTSGGSGSTSTGGVSAAPVAGQQEVAGAAAAAAVPAAAADLWAPPAASTPQQQQPAAAAAASPQASLPPAAEAAITAAVAAAAEALVLVEPDAVLEEEAEGSNQQGAFSSQQRTTVSNGAGSVSSSGDVNGGGGGFASSKPPAAGGAAEATISVDAVEIAVGADGAGGSAAPTRAVTAGVHGTAAAAAPQMRPLAGAAGSGREGVANTDAKQ